MTEVYVLVPRIKTGAIRFISIFLLVLTIGFLLVSCVGMYFLPVAMLAGLGWFLFNYMSNKEYEYSYFDGDVRFARITNKARRKALKGYTMEEVIQIAPSGDRSVSKFEMDKTAKVKDDTSGRKNAPYYVMVVSNGANGQSIIKFEPDKAYLDAVCIKYRQKVVRRPEDQ